MSSNSIKQFVFQQVAHWLSTPTHGYLGSNYGIDLRSELQKPLSEFDADRIIRKMHLDIPVLGRLPVGYVNIFHSHNGIDDVRIFISVGGDLDGDPLVIDLNKFFERMAIQFVKERSQVNIIQPYDPSEKLPYIPDDDNGGDNRDDGRIDAGKGDKDDDGDSSVDNLPPDVPPPPPPEPPKGKYTTVFDSAHSVITSTRAAYPFNTLFKGLDSGYEKVIDVSKYLDFPPVAGFGWIIDSNSNTIVTRSDDGNAFNWGGAAANIVDVVKTDGNSGIGEVDNIKGLGVNSKYQKAEFPAFDGNHAKNRFGLSYEQDILSISISFVFYPDLIDSINSKDGMLVPLMAINGTHYDMNGTLVFGLKNVNGNLVMFVTALIDGKKEEIVFEDSIVNLNPSHANNLEFAFTNIYAVARSSTHGSKKEYLGYEILNWMRGFRDYDSNDRVMSVSVGSYGVALDGKAVNEPELFDADMVAEGGLAFLSSSSYALPIKYWNEYISNIGGQWGNSYQYNSFLIPVVSKMVIEDV